MTEKVASILCGKLASFQSKILRMPPTIEATTVISANQCEQLAR